MSGKSSKQTTSTPAQESEYRGVVLPDGVSPRQFDELRSLFNERADPDSSETNSEFALKAIEVLRRG